MLGFCFAPRPPLKNWPNREVAGARARGTLADCTAETTVTNITNAFRLGSGHFWGIVRPCLPIRTLHLEQATLPWCQLPGDSIGTILYFAPQPGQLNGIGSELCMADAKVRCSNQKCEKSSATRAASRWGAEPSKKLN